MMIIMKMFGVFFVSALAMTCVDAYKCPDAWDFPSCPRDGMDSDYNVCCYADDLSYDCCLGGDLLGPVVIGLLVFAGIVIVIALGVCFYVAFYKARQAVNKIKRKDENIEMQSPESDRRK